MAGRPFNYTTAYTNFAAQGAGTENNIPQLDTNFKTANNNNNDSAIGYVNYAVDTGTVNSYICTLAATPSAYVPGMTIALLVSNTNTAGSVINVNGLGALSIVSAQGNALVAGQLPAGVVVTLVCNGTAFVMATYSDTLIGEVKMIGTSLYPPNWLACNGASYTTSAKPLLFAVIGHSYGGTGANFNVPNFISQVPLHTTPGTTGGSNSVTLSVGQLPSHTHGASSSDSGHTHPLPANASTQAGTGAGVVYIGNGGSGPQSTGTGNASITTTISNTGSGNSINVQNAFQGVQFIIRAA